MAVMPDPRDTGDGIRDNGYGIRGTWFGSRLCFPAPCSSDSQISPYCLPNFASHLRPRRETCFPCPVPRIPWPFSRSGLHDVQVAHRQTEEQETHAHYRQGYGHLRPAGKVMHTRRSLHSRYRDVQAVQKESGDDEYGGSEEAIAILSNPAEKKHEIGRAARRER